MGAPRLGLGGTAGQTDAVGTRDTGSKTCMWPTVENKDAHGSARRRAWQRTEARMAAHGGAHGSAQRHAWPRTGSAHGSAPAAHMAAHRQRAWQRAWQRACGAQAARMQREDGAQAAQGLRSNSTGSIHALKAYGLN